MQLDEIRQLPVYKRLSRLLGGKHPVLINLRRELSKNGATHRRLMPDFYTEDDLYSCILWESTDLGYLYWRDISASLVYFYRFSYL